MRLPRPKTAEALLNTIQAVAIVIGGCWLAFRYFAHEQTAGNLAARQQELANRQAEIQLATAKQHDSLSLEQQRLTTRQAELQLATAKQHDNLSLEQQRLANRQAELSLQITGAQKDLHQRELTAAVALKERDLELRRIEQAKAQHEVTYSGRYRLERNFKLTAKRRRPLDNEVAEYAVRYEFGFTNRSEVPFTASLYVVDFYVGTLEEAGLAFRRFNKPNMRGPTVTTPYDAVNWRHLGAIGGRYGEIPRLPGWVERLPTTIQWNVFGTGEVKPGLETSATETFFITASRDAYVAAFISYCFNGCVNDDDDYTNLVFAPVEDTLPQSAPSGPSVGSGGFR